MAKRNPFQAHMGGGAPAAPAPSGAAGRGPGMNRGGNNRPNHPNHQGGVGRMPEMPAGFQNWLSTDRNIGQHQFGGMNKNRQQRLLGNFPGEPAGPPQTSDDLRMQFYKDNPFEGFFSSMSDLGVNMGGGDAFAQWMNRQYEPAYGQFMSAKLGDPNLRWDHHLAGLGGTDYWLKKYNMDTMENKGLSFAPYEGTSRWLAF